MIYDVRPNSHSEELTIAYLPKQKILWQADLLTGGGINKVMPITVEFAKKLKELKITDFEQMVEAHYSRLIMSEIYKLNFFHLGKEII